MTFDQLLYFVEAYQLKSITKAADKFFISRPVVSNAIKKLEAEFNVQLFIRDSNRIKPTEAGNELYEKSLLILNTVSSIKEGMVKYSEPIQLKNQYTIFIPTPLIHVCGETIFHSLSLNFPQYYFYITSSREKDLSLIHHKIDIAILSGTAEEEKRLRNQLSPEYSIQIVREIPVYVWIKDNHPLFQYKDINYNTLASFRACTLKNIFVNNDNASFLSNVDFQVVDMEVNFIDNLLHYNYYAIDFSLNNKAFFFNDILRNYPVSPRKLNEHLYLYIAYKDKCENFLNLVKQTILNI